MRIDENNSNHLIADAGKIFQRISDKALFGEEIYLGYTYYLNGNKLETPLLERPEDFIEIDAPEEYLMNQEEYGNIK